MIVTVKSFFIPLTEMTTRECEELVARLCEVFPNLAHQRNSMVYAVSSNEGGVCRALRVSPERVGSSAWGTGDTSFYRLGGGIELSVSDVLSYNDR